MLDKKKWCLWGGGFALLWHTGANYFVSLSFFYKFTLVLLTPHYKYLVPVPGQLVPLGLPNRPYPLFLSFMKYTMYIAVLYVGDRNK